jgi:DNA-binding transcriptional ArsR family regulator
MADAGSGDDAAVWLVTEAVRQSRILKALSHEHRLLIMALVRDSERSVGELERLLRQPQPAVSQHLARLRQDGLVTLRRDGRTIYYRANPAAVGEACAGLLDLLGAAGPRSAFVPVHAGTAENSAALPSL